MVSIRERIRNERNACPQHVLLDGGHAAIVTADETSLLHDSDCIKLYRSQGGKSLKIIAGDFVLNEKFQDARIRERTVVLNVF